MRFAQAALQLSDPLAVLFVRPHRSVSPPQRGYRRLFDVFLPAVEQRSCDVVVAAGLSDVAVLQTLDHDGELLFRTSLDLRFSWHLASWKPFASWASPIGARRTITPKATARIERFHRSLKEEEVWLHEYQSLAEARDSIARWIHQYNPQWPHQALHYRTPAATRQAFHQPQPLTKIEALSV